MKKMYPVIALILLFCYNRSNVNAQQLHGAYSINASMAASATNFQTVKSAVDTLVKYGVDSLVVFNIASGTYSEQLVIPVIAGTSDTSTVTFQSAVTHADSVILNYAVGANIPIIKLDGAKYISFKYITVVSTLTTGTAFELAGTASYDSIIHCKISAGNAGISGSPLAGGRNVFSYNTITGGTFGIILQGASSSTLTNNNVITENTILNSGYGLNLYYGSNTFVANNTIIGNNTGIQNYYGSGQRFYHNTITVTAAGSQGCYVNYDIGTWANNEWRNNIITHSGTGTAARITNTGTNNTWDYNLYYTNGPNLFYSTASTYTTWRSNGQDLHSVVLNPGFVSATDLHISSGCRKGITLPVVTSDKEGNTRSTLPDIGAYEYSGIDNIAVDTLSQPVSPITAGVQDLVVRVRNTGTNPVTSFTISYVLNNDSVVSQLWTAGTIAPCDTVLITFPGVNLLTENKLTVYTTLPNGNNDTKPGNDTLKILLNAPLNGAYTIGNSGADFSSFNNAIAALGRTVSGAVVFNVQSGVYLEQLVIPAITGASATNTITFKSAANNADSVTLNYTPGGDVAIVKLDNASYVNFKFLTVASKTPYGRIFELAGTASYDSISYCKINVGNATAGNAGIFASPLAGGKNVFSYNTITGGIYAINLQGINNTLTDSNVITGNTIRNATAYGLYLLYGSNTFVANNTIISVNGIQNFYSSGQRFYHNTIIASGLYACFVTYNNSLWSNNEWRNNIITHSGTNYAQRVTNTGTNNTWDYNVYNAAGSNLLFGTTFIAWQLIGQDTHSLVANPGFVSATDLHLTSGCKTGIVLPAVTTDIEGNIRNAPPTIGAYEYSSINNIAVDSLLKPAFPITAGAQDLVVRVKNAGINPVTSFKISYILNNDSAVSQLWTAGTLAPCDTVSVTFPGVNLLNINKLAVYTAQPNGNSDTNTKNDTLKTILYARLNGMYTIGRSGASFSSFNEAVSALVNGGISGPVGFNVQSGTYTEQLVIPAISGASAANTITFKSVANNTDSVTLNYAAAGDIPIVKLDNASYVSFKYITVASTTTTGRAFELAQTASYDSIVYTKLLGGDCGIYAYSLTGGKNVFGRNVITGSVIGISLQGGTTVLTDSNIITGNTIQTNYGLHLWYSSNTFITNNSIIGNNVGIEDAYNNGQHFYHNTITTSGAFGCSVDYNSNQSVNNEWRNNIITNLGTSPTNFAAYYITNPGPGMNNTWDYNLYYAGGGNLLYNSTSAYNTWRASGQDKHSLVYRPAFTSVTDLRPDPSDSASWAINGRGVHLNTPLISADKNDNPRPVIREQGVPDIGAYELTPNSTVLPPAATIVGALAFDSTQTFLFAGDTVAQIRWSTVVGTTIPDTIEVRQYPGTAPAGITAPDKFTYFHTDIKTSSTSSSINYSCDVSVYYNDAWLGTIATEQDLRFTRKPVNSTTWILFSGFNSTVDTTRNIMADQGVHDFGLFTGTDVNNPLPVAFLSFNANTLAKDVLLTWATASELNSNSFVIERSVDNKTWSIKGDVKASGNTTSVTRYQFNDANAFATAGTLFYRLKIVDNDGSFTYSNTVTVNNKPKAMSGELVIYPNPFGNTVTIELVSEKEGIANISLMDITGRSIDVMASKQILKGNNILPVITDNLQAGIYFLLVEVDGEKQVIKMVKE